MKSLHFISPVALALISLEPAFSADIYVDANATGTANGTSWKNAYTDLQAALPAATSDDIIKIAEGFYYPDEGAGQNNNDPSSVFVLPGKVIIEGGYPTGGSATPDPSQYLTILTGDIDKNDDNPGKDGILGTPSDRNGQNAYHVVKVPSISSGIVLRGVVVTAGHANDGGVDNTGAGILLEPTAGLRLENCRISGNEAASNGGGIFGEKGTLVVINCLFTGNSATGGGAIFKDGGTLDLTNTSILGNRADLGGGAYLNEVLAEFVNTSFSGNAADDTGGAIFLDKNTELEVTNSIAWENIANGETNSGKASIFLTGGATAFYSHTLMHGLDLSTLSSSNLNGKDLENNPRFHLQPAPGAAPGSAGNLRLRLDSPLFDIGINSANSQTADLAGRTRKVNTIDLGAYEFQRELFVDDTAGGLGHGGSWGDAFTKLQDALAAAKAGWQINVARGIYFPDEGVGQTNNLRESTFQLRNNISLIGGYPNGGGARNPKIWKSILSGDLQKDDLNLDNDQIGNGSTDFQGTNALHVVTGSGVGPTAVLDGFVITGGNAVSAFGTFKDQSGGGMIIEGGSPSINSCSFIGNHAYQYGGAVSHLLAGTDPVYNDCTFSWNEVSGSGSPVQGGAVYAAQGPAPIFISCEFRANSSAYYGGAIAGSSATVTAENCLFSGNRATNRGGAVSLFSTSLNLTGCTFSANAAFEGSSAGGAVYSASGDLVVKNTIMWNNRSGGSQGGADSSYSVLFSISDPDPATNSFNHCIIEGRNLTNTGTGNLNGGLPESNPDFLIPAPTFGDAHADGDYHLADASPAANAGSNTHPTQSTDLDGENRIQFSTTDIGAYEGTSPDPDSDDDGIPDTYEFANTTPASYTSLDPQSDNDKDGFTALEEYAHGLNPNIGNKATDGMVFTTANVSSSEFPALTFFRKTAVTRFLKFSVEHSEDLGQNDPWSSIPVTLVNSNTISQTYRSTLGFTERDKQFLRLKIGKISP